MLEGVCESNAVHTASKRGLIISAVKCACVCVFLLTDMKFGTSFTAPGRRG